MSADSTAFSVTAKGSNQELVTIRGNSWDDLNTNAQAAGINVAILYVQAFGATGPTVEAIAEANVVRAFPQAAPVAQPVPQPGAAAPAVTGPTCAHGARVYKDTVSAKGPWRRWECAIPWQRNADNSARCPNVNA